VKSPGEHLSLREAADALGISEVSARRWVKSGRLKAYQPGRKYLVPMSAVEELLEETRSPKAPTPSHESASVTALPDAEERIDYREVYFQKRREHRELISAIIDEAGEVMGTEDYEEFIRLPYDEQHRRINYAERLTNLAHESLKHFDDDDLPEELEHKVTHLRTTVEEFKKIA
jgi:excisionase family DNA binding protein